MIISSLWIKRKGNEEGAAELLTAWDEYSIDENWIGWQEDCEESLKACGDEVADKRFIRLHVSEEEIDALFVRGDVSVTRVSAFEDQGLV